MVMGEVNLPVDSVSWLAWALVQPMARLYGIQSSSSSLPNHSNSSAGLSGVVRVCNEEGGTGAASDGSRPDRRQPYQQGLGDSSSWSLINKLQFAPSDT